MLSWLALHVCRQQNKKHMIVRLDRDESCHEIERLNGLGLARFVAIVDSYAQAMACCQNDSVRSAR